jgi:hypothetical protein
MSRAKWWWSLMRVGRYLLGTMDQGYGFTAAPEMLACVASDADDAGVCTAVCCLYVRWIGPALRDEVARAPRLLPVEQRLEHPVSGSTESEIYAATCCL